jgi:LTXXQ motif family protein
MEYRYGEMVFSSADEEIIMRSAVKAWKWISAIATFVSVGGGLGAAVAQEQDMPGATGRGMSGRGMASCRMDEHIDGQLAYLKTELRITDAQTPQWNVFANTFRADKEKDARLCKSTDNEESRSKMMSASLPDSLEMMAVRLTVRLESLRAMEAAIRPLYSILSKEQKKTADEIMKGASNF